MQEAEDALSWFPGFLISVSCPSLLSRFRDEDFAFPSVPLRASVSSVLNSEAV
jgi:hypothetical protein